MPYKTAVEHAQSTRPYRQIRASHTESTIIVYQAYNESIAASAVIAGTFVSPPFKRDRMTWVKPSFLWMMYRAGWGAKDTNQARILAITLKREGFEAGLRMAQLSHYIPEVHGSNKEEWEVKRVAKSPVVVQWDPERDCHGQALRWRSLQIGLRDDAVGQYVDEWIASIEDITERCHEIKRLVDEGNVEEAYAMIPVEDAYELPADLAGHIGTSSPLKLTMT
jgi:hypothetical protein